DLIVLGDAGGAGGVAARAVLAALGAERAALLTDAAADAGAAATAALALNERHLGDPLEALRRVGGREVAALAGAVLAARIEGVPVILDGLPALAGAAVVAATAGETTALDHCRLAEAAGPAARAAAEHLALTPLVDFAIAAGEGTAGALAASLVKSAAAVATPPPAPQDGAPAG
ncbi:nicotinate-nucleotide--dimethylbenzimidazole phosphoribosyltransferase, partial [Aquibium sp. A9E412]|uniref:nicotinate-nucleotide--dimethylbenzimidazole phosphoribosyltransferase n=1 Tax=Aquibium sp. A9E412 TaxID=2976767 RepID=UPI0025B20D1B